MHFFQVLPVVNKKQAGVLKIERELREVNINCNGPLQNVRTNMECFYRDSALKLCFHRKFKSKSLACTPLQTTIFNFTEYYREMIKQFSVRYGRNYKVVLALVLPCLLILPFILWMQRYPPHEEWKIWLTIFIFLGAVISLSIWLAVRSYPPTVLSINDNEISLSFDHTKFLSPSDFSFYITDITSFNRREIRGDEYFIFETSNPSRKFQISSASYEVENFLSFNEAMVEISEMVNKQNELY